MATAQDRQLRLLINKANGNFVTFRFRHTVESLMTVQEMPLSLCLVSNVWINEAPVPSSSAPWVILTDRQLIVVLTAGLFGRRDCTCFPIADLREVTELSGHDFDITLGNDTKVTVRSRPWPDKKFTEGFRDELAESVGRGIAAP